VFPENDFKALCYHINISIYSDVYFAEGDVTHDALIIHSFFPNRSHERKKAKMASNRAGFMECKQTHGKEMTKKGSPTKTISPQIYVCICVYIFL